MSCTIPKKLKIQRCFSNKDLKSLLSDFNINSRTSLKCSLFFADFGQKLYQWKQMCLCTSLQLYKSAPF